MTARAATPAVAFFDVDGTLTTEPTLFTFLRFYLTAAGYPDQEYHARRDRLRDLTARGASRTSTNLAYFQNWAGAEPELVAQAAQEWFATHSAQPLFWNAHVVRALRQLQSKGARTVLVSGSFPACLEPLATSLGADLVACAEPAVQDGRYTGRLTDAPMIGTEKELAIIRIATTLGVSPNECVSFGDHTSDLPMLLATGTAVIVGDDDVLLARAAAAGWARLPGSALPT